MNLTGLKPLLYYRATMFLVPQTSEFNEQTCRNGAEFFVYRNLIMHDSSYLRYPVPEEWIPRAISMIYPKDMDVLYASRDTDNLVYHIKNVAAAITVAEPALVKVLLTTRIDNKMPMEVARPFWYGCVLGVLQGLTARAEIDLNAVLISRTVRELASAFAGYLDEAVKYGYTSTFICESSKEVEQELSEAITKLTKKLGHRFADSFSEPFQGTERGFHEQVLRNVLIKSFAGATLLQLKTASRYRNHSSLAVLDTKAVISVGEIQTGTASPYRQQV